MELEKGTAPERQAQELSDDDFRHLKKLADNKFAAFLQSIVVPESLNDQKVDNL